MSIRLENHVTILSILHIGLSAFVLLATSTVLLILIGGGFLSGEMEAVLATWGVGFLLGGVVLFLTVPGLIGGLGLLKRKAWARILVLVLGFLHLVSFPLGTLLGIYTIWILMQDEAEEYFAAA